MFLNFKHLFHSRHYLNEWLLVHDALLLIVKRLLSYQFLQLINQYQQNYHLQKVAVWVENHAMLKTLMKNRLNFET